ncbi:unnamed protein product, partial [Symbiodinium microadriaticum]
VSDEESSQTKAFHFLFSHVGCRGLCQPEISHPKWNSFKRALAASGLEFDILKLTVIANYAHGPYAGGDRLVMKQEMLASFLQKQTQDYFADIAAEICLDQDASMDTASGETAAMMLEDFMSSDALKNRGLFLKNKVWFGMINVFRSLLKTWTLHREAAWAICAESGFDMDDNDDAGGAEADENKDPPQKWTRSALYKAYSGKGPHKMNLEFLADADLRAKAALVVHITEPLHRAYMSDLHAQQAGPESQMDWISSRAAGKHFQVVLDILRATASSEMYREMRLAPPSHPPMDPENEYLRGDVELVQKAWDFAVNLASNILWGQLLYRYTLPLGSAGLLAETTEQRQLCLDHMRALVETVVEAEELVRKGPHAVADVLQDVAWPMETLAREIMVRLWRSDFDESSPEAFDLRRLVLRTFLGPSSTKEILESTFSHLHDVIGRHAKNQKASNASMYFYTIASPYSKKDTCGMEHQLPEHRDWVKWRTLFSHARQEFTQQYNNSMNVNATALPRGSEIPASSAGVKKTKWRLAGPLSHYRSSAGLLFLLEDKGSGFSNCRHAWAAGLLKCGKFFWKQDTISLHISQLSNFKWHTTTARANTLSSKKITMLSFLFLLRQPQDEDKVVLSLGFHGWCAVGLEVRSMWLNGREFLTVGSDLDIDDITAMFNFDVAEETCPWTGVRVRILPPACVPRELQGAAMAFEVLSRDGWILKDALLAGDLNIKVEQLRQTAQSIGATLPLPGKGSGKNGNVVQADIVAALLRKVFPDETDEFRDTLFQKLVGKKAATVDISVLATISELDEDNASAFKDMKKRAMELFQETVYGEGMQTAMARKLDEEKDEKKRQENFQQAKERADNVVLEQREENRRHAERQCELTPRDLKSLLPGGGEISGVCWARYNPHAQWFSVQYPVSVSSSF